jgi:hypothetical protein
MNWIFEHIQIVIAVAAAIAYMLNRGKQAPEGGASEDGEDSERARRIREEIRRKIAERREGAPAPLRQETPAAAPPVIRAPGVPPLDSFGGPARPALPTLRKPEPVRTHAPQPAPAMSHAAMSAVLERQAQLAEQLRELEQAREKQKLRAAEIAADAAPAAPAAPVSRGGLLADLRQAQNLRRAILLREVLGPPVALR